MQFYSPIIIKFALGIICLIVQINLMGKGNLAPHRLWTKCKTMYWGHYWWCYL